MVERTDQSLLCQEARPTMLSRGISISWTTITHCNGQCGVSRVSIQITSPLSSLMFCIGILPYSPTNPLSEWICFHAVKSWKLLLFVHMHGRPWSAQIVVHVPGHLPSPSPLMSILPFFHVVFQHLNLLCRTKKKITQHVYGITQFFNNRPINLAAQKWTHDLVSEWVSACFQDWTFYLTT